MKPIRAVLPVCTLLCASSTFASIVSFGSGDTLQGIRGSNLLVNGSFEADDGSAFVQSLSTSP